MCLQDCAVGGNTVAFRQDQKVFANDFAAGNPRLGTIPNGQGSWTGQIAEGFQGIFSATFLQNGDHHDDDHKAQQDQRFVGIAHCEIDCPGTQQQQEHRFPRDFSGNGEYRASLVGAQFIGAIGRQPGGCLVAG